MIYEAVQHVQIQTLYQYYLTVQPFPGRPAAPAAKTAKATVLPPVRPAPSWDSVGRNVRGRLDGLAVHARTLRTCLVSIVATGKRGIMKRLSIRDEGTGLVFAEGTGDPPAIPSDRIPAGRWSYWRQHCYLGARLPPMRTRLASLGTVVRSDCPWYSA